MIIFNESLTTVEQTDYGFEIKSPVYCFNSNTIPDPLTLESITEFILEAKQDRFDKIASDFNEFMETHLKPITEL